MSLNKTTTAEKLEKVKKIVYKSAGTLTVYGLDHRFPLMESNDEVNETGVTEAYRINNHKIKGVYRFNLTGKLKRK